MAWSGRAAAAALAWTLSAAGGSQAQTSPADVVMSAFRSLCLATGGDRAAALAAADRADWSPAPDAAMAASAPLFQNPAGRLHVEASGFQFLIVGERTRTLGGRLVKLRTCGVGGSVLQVARLDAAAQELAAVPRSARLSDAEHAVWVFTEENGRHVPLDDAEPRRVASAVESGALRVIARQTHVTPGMPTGLTTVLLDVPAR